MQMTQKGALCNLTLKKQVADPIIPIFQFFLAFYILLSCFEVGHDNQDYADGIGNEHKRQQFIRFFRRFLKFLPDKDTPEGSYHSSTLAESISNCGACGAGCDIV